MSAECKTCGSNNPKVRGMLSAYDCDIDFAGPASNRVSSQETSTGNGKWYCGLCPDTWHDYERRCGKERRSTTPTTQSREADVEAGIAATIKFIENGSFLCDDSPPARFAKEVVAGIRRTVHAKDILASTTPAPVGDESPSLAKARDAYAVELHHNTLDQLAHSGMKVFIPGKEPVRVFTESAYAVAVANARREVAEAMREAVCKVLEGPMDEDGLNDDPLEMGIYPLAVRGYNDERDYEQRDGFKNGWNAACWELLKKRSKIRKEIEALDPATILAQHRDVPRTP